MNDLFQTIASRYDFITAFLSYGMDKGWKKTLIEMTELRGGESVLDLACGTGDITFLAASRLNTGSAVGLDITQGMVDLAEQKRAQAGAQNVSFIRGDIMNLPFPDASFDVITAGYALRNVPDIAGGLDEIRRVLKPGGRICSLDFAHPGSKTYRWLYFRYLVIVGSALGWILHRDKDTYRYIAETLKLYPGQQKLRLLMEQKGFARAEVREFGGGIMAINSGLKEA